jgi:hypothetical protein
MQILMKRVCVTTAVLGLLAVPLIGQQANLTTADQQALADFNKRVKEYASFRGQLNKGDAKQRETKDASKISDARANLAAKIRAQRAGAKAGDIFTPAIQERFRKVLAPEMAGVKGQNTKGSIKDEAPAPGSIKMEVNGEYPKEQPLGTVPPNVLKALPELPEGVEFRFVDRYLTLRDAKANLIIDYMPAAIPKREGGRPGVSSWPS